MQPAAGVSRLMVTWLRKVAVVWGKPRNECRVGGRCLSNAAQKETFWEEVEDVR